MSTENDKILQSLYKGEDINSTTQHSTRVFEDKDGYVQKLEAEIIKLKAEITEKSKSAGILEALFSNSISAVAILDRNYNFVRVNDKYVKGSGHHVADYFGHNHFEFYPSEAIEIFDNVVKTKEVYKVLARPFIDSNNIDCGVTYWDWTLTPVLDASGDVELLILNLVDVTEAVEDKARLTETLERYHAIFENAVDGIILGTSEGTILAANSAACRLFGRNETELCEVGRSGIVDMEDPRVWAALKDRAMTGSFFSEFTMVRKDGSKFLCEVTSRLYKVENNGVLATFILRDITDRKQAEEALRISEEKFAKVFNNN